MNTESSAPASPKVWLVGATFEPRGSSLYTLRLASHLPALGYDVEIVCESANHIPAKIRSQVPIHVIPRLQSPLLGTAPLMRLAQKVERPPDLIHSQRLGLERVGDLLAEEFDRPHLLTVHHVAEDVAALAIPPEELAAVVAVSPSVERDLVHKASVPPGIIRMIPSGVEIATHPRLPMPRDPERVPVVGTASVLESSKGLLYFLMAADLILSAGHDVEFIVAGTGPDEELLRRAAHHMDIDQRVTFVPQITSFTRVIETFDLFVLPSLEQGLGSIMLEAMALGKPVVATKVGGVADFVVDGEHALLVEKANHVLLADKIEMLLDFPDKARQLSLRGQALVREKFSAERMGRDTAQLYRDIQALSRAISPL
jgi:glycosyltransferase involved in cell wall biosynthesis